MMIVVVHIENVLRTSLTALFYTYNACVHLYKDVAPNTSIHPQQKARYKKFASAAQKYSAR